METEKKKNYRDYIKTRSRKELETIAITANIEEDRLRDKLSLLSGCRYFGDEDTTDKDCVDCSIFDRCCLFSEALSKYRKNSAEANGTSNAVSATVKF